MAGQLRPHSLSRAPDVVAASQTKADSERLEVAAQRRGHDAAG